MNIPKINYKNPLLIATAAGVLCLVVAVGVYFALRVVLPKEGASDSRSSSESSSQLSKEALIKKADESAAAGQKALEQGDAKTAVAKLSEAEKIYKQTGKTIEAEQTGAQLSLAMHEAANTEKASAPPTTDQEKR